MDCFHFYKGKVVIVELKEFKKKIKELGYKVKTYTYNTSSLRFLEILDHDKKFVGGSGANAYPAEHMEKHRAAFNLLGEYRDQVFDKGTKVIF